MAFRYEIQLAGLVALVGLAGCGKKPAAPETATPTPTKPAQPVAAQPAAQQQPLAVAGGGGAVQAVRGAAVRSVSQAELHDLHLFLENAAAATGQLPPREQTLTMLKRPDGNRKLVEMIEAGDIVLNSPRSREGVWAYDKAALSAPNGGMILTNNGVQRVNSPQELRQLLGQ